MGTAAINKEDDMSYRKFALKAAKDLCYGEEVIDLIKNAKNNEEIERIMISARKGLFSKKGG